MSNTNAAMTQGDTILQKVHVIRTMLIAVGMGKRIDDTEGEYTELRGHVSADLRSLGISDPNGFQSLWDWYGYWKANGLSSYQSRREYINALYKPVIEALEAPPVKKTQDEVAMDKPTFSVRQGYINPDSQAEITIREDAPDDVRIPRSSFTDQEEGRGCVVRGEHVQQPRSQLRMWTIVERQRNQGLA